MNTSMRIRRAQIHGAMNLWCVQSIAALQEGRRLVRASAGSKQRAVLAGITEYWTPYTLFSPISERDFHDAPDDEVHLRGNSVILQKETAVL